MSSRSKHATHTKCVSSTQYAVIANRKFQPNTRRISNKTTLTLTLSRPTGEGTARPVPRSFQSGWIRRPTGDDSPSPIRWERAGVRVGVPQNRKLFLHEPLARAQGAVGLPLFSVLLSPVQLDSCQAAPERPLSTSSARFSRRGSFASSLAFSWQASPIGCCRA